MHIIRQQILIIIIDYDYLIMKPFFRGWLLFIIFLVVPVHCQDLISVSNDTICPPWFFYNESIGQCQCFESLNVDVRCTSEGALLRFGRCMTYQEGIGTAVGSCAYYRVDSFLDNVTEGLFITLPSNVIQLNDYMCQPLNRKGYQCNECFDGFGVSLTSLGYQCSNCSGIWYGVPLYLLLEFVPVTIFYVIILVYRVNVTSAPMTSFVMFSQLIFYSFTQSVESQSVFRTQLANRQQFDLLNVVIALYGIWNLDFFRHVIPPFCVSPNIKLIHAFFLDYVVAFYPLCLITLTWIWIELVSRRHKPLVWICANMRRCCFGANWKWDKKRTVIDVFATFLLLSYTKILLISLTIIAPTRVRFLSPIGNSSQMSKSLDLSIGYFSQEHLPFAIPAIFIFVLFVILPAMVLALYPLKAFQRLLRKIKLFKHQRAALHLFVEKFYSSYRDGLDGGKDMRSLASLYFFLRFVLIIFHQSSLELIGLSGAGVGDAQVVAIFLRVMSTGAVAVFIITVRPYKETYANILDTLILSTMALLTSFPVVYLFAIRDVNSQVGRVFFYTSIIILCTPHLGPLTYVFIKFYQSKRPLNWLKLKLMDCKRKYQSTSRSRKNKVIEPEGSLPDRIIHPECY